MRILKIESLENVKHAPWIDRDCIMLHACFQILVDAIEKEEVDKECDYEHHKKDIDEVRFLYDWWQKRKFDDSVESDKDDDNMLIRLMKVRSFLWT